jgi:acetamidase/formamidase
MHGWDNSVPPAIVAAPGDELVLELAEPSGGQYGPESTAAAISTFDVSIANPITGPIYVEGAAPGDVLEVEIRHLELGYYGWTQQNPGWGLLPADEFPEAWLNIWDLRVSPAPFRPGVAVPLEPMIGVIGVALAEPGHHSVVPPRQVGGNMDVRQHRTGTRVFLPVEVEGALLGIGDGHAAQGDGEVCGSAIEAPMTATIRIGIRRDMGIRSPQFHVTRPLERESAARAGYHATTGIAPDLMEAARDAVRSMIGYLTTRGLTRQEAYCLCSVAVDLKVSEVVDRPNWVVSAFLPLDVFA